MGNCLITKLKGVVDNPSLKKLGEMDIIFSDNKNDVAFTFSKNTTIEIANGTIQYGGGSYTTLDCTAGSSYHIGITLNNASVPAILKVNKYDIAKYYTYFIGNYDIDVEDFTYSNDLTEVTIVQNVLCVGDIKGFSGKNITTLNLFGTKVHGNLSDLPTTIGDLRYGSAPIPATMADFARFTNLYNLNTAFNALVTGTIEEFAQAFIAAGKTSGSITISGNSFVTYQGQSLINDHRYKVTFDGDTYTVGDA